MVISMNKKEVAEDVNENKTDTTTSCSRRITVEPVMLLQHISYGMISVLTMQYMTLRVDQEYGLNVTSTGQTVQCSVNTSDTYYILEQTVQAEAAKWITYQKLSYLIPALIFSMLYGLHSDHFGRKLAIIPPCIGFLCFGGAHVVVILFHLPKAWLICGTVLYGVGGTIVGLWGAIFTYISDITSDSNRLFRTQLLTVTSCVGSLIGGILGGYMTEIVGFLYTAVIQMCICSLSVLYVVFLLPETTYKPRDNGGSPNRLKTYLNSMKQVYSKPRARHGKIKILLCLCLVAIAKGLQQGMTTVEILYLLNAPLCWGTVPIGYFTGVKLMVPALGGSIAIFHLQNHLPDMILVSIGAFLRGLSALIEGLAVTLAMMISCKYSFLETFSITLLYTSYTCSL